MVVIVISEFPLYSRRGYDIGTNTEFDKCPQATSGHRRVIIEVLTERGVSSCYVVLPQQASSKKMTTNCTGRFDYLCASIHSLQSVKTTRSYYLSPVSETRWPPRPGVRRDVKLHSLCWPRRSKPRDLAASVRGAFQTSYDNENKTSRKLILLKLIRDIIHGYHDVMDNKSDKCNSNRSHDLTDEYMKVDLVIFLSDKSLSMKIEL
uniref:(California timema) hypothetical protein n=1 Tax=Timema californicum TaxID=61474 RepID=A0A7R9J445_TIMCA|nr:unnamed protein product [Timema californicum]